MAGAAVSVGIQVAAIAVAFGTSVLWDYANVVMHLGELNFLLEPRPAQMHSLTSLTRILPAPLGAITWTIAAVAIVAKTINVWRSPVPISLQMALLIVASLLVNPHLFVYDAAVLALPLVWFAAWVYGEPHVSARTRAVFTLLVYALYVSFLAPTAQVIPIQGSVLCLVTLFVMMARHVQSHRLVPVAVAFGGADGGQESAGLSA